MTKNDDRQMSCFKKTSNGNTLANKSTNFKMLFWVLYV